MGFREAFAGLMATIFSLPAHTYLEHVPRGIGRVSVHEVGHRQPSKAQNTYVLLALQGSGGIES